MDDILIQDSGEPVLESGDFVVGDATRQNQQLILVSTKGSWRQSPVVGVGAVDYLLDSEDNEELKKEVRKQMELDGMNVIDLSVIDSSIFLDAEYNG